MFFQHNTELEDALRFSRFDDEHVLSTCSNHSFTLEDEVWPTAEHYYQANKFQSAYKHTVKTASTGHGAHKLGNKWLKRKRSDFKKVRNVLMMRALYSKTIQNDEVKQFLLETGDQKIIETSLFDPYWGIARDQRGENMLGKIWMDIRKKIREDAA